MLSLTNQKVLRDTLHKFGFYTKKDLGQNFLVDQFALEEIVASAEIEKGDEVLEIGPGPGVLTQQLVTIGANITALEVDETVIPVLQYTTGNPSNLKIINQSALTYHPEKPGFILCANIPYYLTSPIIRHYLGGDNRPKRVIFLIQREVAKKICEKPGHYSVLSLQVAIYGKAEIVGDVNRNSFFPVPKVDSSILRITVYDKPLILSEDLSLFWHIVHHSFTEKRKKIINTLCKYRQMGTNNAIALLEKSGIDQNNRPQALSIEDWKNLIKVLKEIS